MRGARQKRDTEYYLALKYPVVVRELQPEEGGGFMATIPQLGSSTFVADGESAAEAMEALDEVRHYLIPKLLEKGVELPDPEIDAPAVEQFSGNLVLRVPRGLHGRLATAAKRNGCSINKLATEILAAGIERTTVISEVDRVVAAALRDLRGSWEQGASGTTRKADNQKWFGLKSDVELDPYSPLLDEQAA